MPFLSDVGDRLLSEYFNFQLTFDSQQRKILFLCLFLFITGLLRLVFWRISPVIYDSALFLFFYGAGKILVLYEWNLEIEKASDFVNINVLYMMIPVFVFTSTFEFRSAFGSYFFMWILLISLVPIFIFNLYTISWVIFIAVEKNYDLSFTETLHLTLIFSPCQVIYILDYLQTVQGQTTELKYKLRTEQYSSMWLSFVVADFIREVEYRSSHNTLNPLGIFIFIAFQVSGLLFGYIWSRIVRYPVRKANDMVTIATATTIITTFMIQAQSVLLGFSYTLAVGAFGIVINAIMNRCNHETLEFFSEYWSLVLFLANSLTTAIIGTALGISKESSGIGLIRIVILAYCLFLALRFTLLALVYPLLGMSMGAKTHWVSMAIQVIGVYKGGINHIIALHYAVLNPHNGYIILELAICFTMMAYFFNVILFPGVVSIMGLNKYSLSKMANMNVAMSQTNYCREKAIFALKMDKVVVDANWLVVEEVTRLVHPYKKSFSESTKVENGKDDFQLRFVSCPECQTEVLPPPTKRELEFMKQEAKERMIKSQMVSFSRQFEMGSLTIREYDYLVNVVEVAMGSHEFRVKPESIKTHSMLCAVGLKMKVFLQWFSELTAEVYYKIPKTALGEYCFQISISKNMRILLAVCTLLDTIFMMVQVIVYYCMYNSENGHYSYNGLSWNYGFVAQYMHLGFYCISLVEVTAGLIGLGLDQYFSRNVNKIEFSVGIVLGTLEILIFSDHCLRVKATCHPFSIPVVMLIKSIMPLRLAKIYILLSAIVPKIISGINNILADEMMRNYELGKAYLVALNQTSTLLNRIVYSEVVYNDLMADIDADRLYMSKVLGLLQKENPSIATTVKTRHAIRYVINAMGDCIKDMKEEGVIDFIEAEGIQMVLNKNIEGLRELTYISAPPPEDILKNVPWLKDEDENFQYLLQNAVLTNYDYGDVLLHAGDDPVGIHLLVSGLLKSHYIPSSTTLQLSSKFGVLPNYDFFHNVKFDQPQESYVVSGSIIGEIGTVSGRRYDMSVKCETAVQVYYISWEALKKVIYENVEASQILSKIWKAISIKVAVNILQYNVVNFQGWPPEKLLLYLNKGFVPLIPDLVSIIVTNKVEVIVLIEGKLMDATNRRVYTGPCHIPKNVYKLLLPEHKMWNFQTICETKMLIIPTNITTEEELKGPEGIFTVKSSHVKAKVEQAQRKVGFTVESEDSET